VSAFAHLTRGSPFNVLFPITSAVPFAGETVYNYGISSPDELNAGRDSTFKRKQALALSF